MCLLYCDAALNRLGGMSRTIKLLCLFVTVTTAGCGSVSFSERSWWNASKAKPEAVSKAKPATPTANSNAFEPANTPAANSQSHRIRLLTERIESMDDENQMHMTRIQQLEQEIARLKATERQLRAKLAGNAQPTRLPASKTTATATKAK